MKTILLGELLYERSLANKSVSFEQEMYHVTFHNGARTTLHYHESNRILLCHEWKRGPV